MNDFCEIAAEVGIASADQQYLIVQSKWVSLKGLRRYSYYQLKTCVVVNDSEVAGDITEEVDPAGLPNNSNINVIWDVVHSNSFNVPVLYFNAYVDSQPISSVEFLQENGIIKSTSYVSLTDHPLSNSSCFFIHPCNLSQAVEEILREDDKADYMKVWRMIIDTLVYIN